MKKPYKEWVESLKKSKDFLVNFGSLQNLRPAVQALSEKNGPIQGVRRNAAMTSHNQTGIEGNEVHVRSEPQFLSD